MAHKSVDIRFPCQDGCKKKNFVNGIGGNPKLGEKKKKPRVR